MDSNPEKPGRFRDKLGCQDKTWKVWGAASLLLFEKHVVGGNASWKDARFVPIPFIHSCRPGVALFLWQVLKSSWDRSSVGKAEQGKKGCPAQAIVAKGLQEPLMQSCPWRSGTWLGPWAPGWSPLPAPGQRLGTEHCP